MERTDQDVDQYLERLDSPRAADLRELDAVIAAEFAGLERVMWEGVMWGGTEQRIVGYGAISQSRPRGPAVDWFLVGVAEQQRHLSVYVNAAEDGGYLAPAWAPRLGRVKAGAAALTFSRLEDLDLTEFRGLLCRARSLAPDVR
ncbi:hypothetical protein BJ978_001366 [Agromyces terreus]|uniref:DUF1801 domain-containing protein n=1 Tax=Agromyces terreus TaxID=424795 RepID=A0A9X2KBZ6_9MICO|nr:DUF1801 domain-containing protein [Agromyces terreus]MCP2370690.1 hypothetical protein [Agromyces terreus]